MGLIHVLSDHLANQIAAGEVIERPANVVKELVENSIDAKADQIQIQIEDGGLALIKITDNGSGMSADDAKLCFLRHATSKIRDDFDLFRIQSLGFRGEAIPSIASVSHFDLKTCQNEVGYRIVYEFGQCLLECDDDARKGTEITVTKLFQNVPARLKYMKSVNTEFAAIQNYVEKLAISYPKIAFTLMHQGRIVLKTKGNGQLLEVIATIYGLQVAKNMMAVDFGDDEFHITGYLSKLDLTRSNKSYIMILVNHRVVKNQLATDAINQVYRPYLASDRFPMAFINIEIDPFLVDVNVHPAKLEVRFSKSAQLRELLLDGFKAALNQEDLTFRAVYEKPKRTFEKKDYQQESFDLSSKSFTAPLMLDEKEELISERFEAKHIVPSSQEALKETTASYTPSYLEKEQLADAISMPVHEIEKTQVKTEPVKQKVMKRHLKVKAQIHGTYLIAEDEEGMYIIDQHAAKERVNYEYYLEKFKCRDMRLSDMLVPIVLEYPQSECMLLRERKDVLKAVGIELEDFGVNSFVVKRLPLWMKRIDEQLYIEEMVSQLLHMNEVNPLVLEENAIATLSCKASVKGNTYLDQANMQHIVDELMCCDNPYVCPHGRPTIISYTSYELEKLFKRVV